jgi:hypothetical protein
MLVTLAEMKTFLGISTTDYDAFLTLQLQIVSEAVEGYCNRVFADTDYTQFFFEEDFYSLSKRTMSLYHFPLTDITAVEEADTEDATTWLPVTPYRHHDPTAVLTATEGGFFRLGRVLKVEYSAGYATIPAVVSSVVYSIVQERYNKKVNGIDLNFGSDVQRVSIPGTISIDFDYSLSTNERKSAYGAILGNNLNLLDPYRSERALVGDSRLSYVS